MTTFLLLGALLGLRHALEADHLAAVATLATRQRGIGRALMQGTAWGVGHGAALLAVGGACLLLRLTVPARLAHMLEGAVGTMLVVLGVGVLRRMVKARIHLHVHRHDDGTVHLHAHSHGAEGAGAASDAGFHRHDHAAGMPLRALAVGMMHGLAGTAALLLLVASSLGTPAMGLLYIACFSAGAVVGMAALSVVIALPLRGSTGSPGATGWLARTQTVLEAVAGSAAVGIGLWVIYTASGRF